MDSDIRGETIPARLKYWADRQPLKPAFIFVSREGTRTVFTSQQIYQLAQQFAQRLCKLGVKPGDVVCNLLQDGPDCIVSFFGILCAGCTLQNGVVQMEDGRFLLENLNKTKCRAVVLSSDPDDTTSRIISQYFDDVSGNNVTCGRLPDLKFVIYTMQGEQSRHKGFQWPPEVATDNRMRQDERGCRDIVTGATMSSGDAAVIAATSGTTGASKLILDTHRNILGFTMAPLLAKVNEVFDPNFSVIDPHPISWLWGIPFPYMELGCSIVRVDYTTHKDDEYMLYIRDIIIRENCQVAKISAKDAFLLLQLNEKDSITYKDWPLRIILMSGQPLTVSALQLTNTLTKTLYNVYVSSEMGIVSAKKIDKDSEFEEFNVGYVLDGIELKLVDADMKEVPTGSFGQLLVRTPNIFQGYVGEEELTRSCFTSDGWYRTNDYARLTQQGELILQGRFGDVIMRGENYYHPSWIETIIRQCPGVANVLVVKVPDETLMYEICACIIPEVPSDNIADKVQDFCSREFIVRDSGDKTARPKYYLKMDSFPTSTNGKIDRKQLEKTAAKLLELE